MRFRYALLLALLWTTTAPAASLVVSSDPVTYGRGLAPQTLSRELRRSGAGPAPRIEVGLGYALREVKVASLVCETGAGGIEAGVQCSFLLPGSTVRSPVADPRAVYQALSHFSEGAEALPLKTCDSTGACRIAAAAVFCLENSRLSDAEKGKFVCGVVSL